LGKTFSIEYIYRNGKFHICENNIIAGVVNKRQYLTDSFTVVG